MFRGYLLRYLAAASAVPDVEAAAKAVPTLVRPLVLARARPIVARCGLATEHADDEAHVHRLAYLVVRGREAPNANDVAAVSAWFVAHRNLRAEDRALVTTLLALTASVGLLVVVGGGWRYLGARPSSERDLQPATALDVERSEPEPKPASPLDHFFQEALPTWVVALDAESGDPQRAMPGEVARHHGALVAAIEHENTALAAPLGHFLEAAERYTRGGVGEEAALAVTQSLGVLDDALSTEAAPFYVDAVLLESRLRERHRLLVSTYAVRRRRGFVSGALHVTALDLARLDTLNFEQSMLGYTRPEIAYALVLTERVAKFLITQALPSMHAVEESAIVRDYHDELGTAWVTPLEQAFHEDLRAEGIAVISEKALRDLAAAIVRRQHAAAAMSMELRHANVALKVPATYAYDVSMLDRFAARVPHETLNEVVLSQQALSAGPLRAAYDALENAYLTSVARHEAQHRLDFLEKRVVAVPGALAAYTGRSEPAGERNRFAERTNAELSAYLSQVAREPRRAHTNLIYSLAFVMDRHQWGSAEGYAALVILEELARQLGIAHQAFIVDHRIVRRELAHVYSALRTRTAEEIAQAARTSWRALYGTDLPVLELEP